VADPETRYAPGFGVPVGSPLSKIGSASRRQVRFCGRFVCEALSILEVRRKPQAFAAVAVMQVGIMEIECSFVIRLMLLGPAIVDDADGQR
jgi:hypothetical protein